jgi:ankyrin repeat protein
MATIDEVKHEDIPGLAAVLQDEHAGATRLYEAAKALQQEGSAEALDVLADLIYGPNSDNWDAGLVRFAGAALSALGEAGLERALTALEDGRQPVRCEAARALGAIGGSEAAAALLRHLDDDREDGLVREISAGSLLEIGPEVAQAAIERYLTGDDDRILESVVCALADHPAPWATAGVVAALRAGKVSHSQRDEFVGALTGVAGPDLVPGLVDVLDNGTADARWVAVEVLAKLEDPASWDGLVRAAGVGPREVRLPAAQAVRAMEGLRPDGLDAGSAAIVEAALDDAPWEVFEVLAGRRDPGENLSGGGTPVMWAAAHGEAKVAARLIEMGADVNRTNPAHGETALMLAAREGSLDVMRLLLDAGAVVDARLDPPSGETALHLASLEGRADAVALLLERGADANDLACGTTPLIKAAAAHRLDAMRCLLDAGADPRLRNSDGTDALTLVFAARVLGLAGGIATAPEEAETIAAAQLLLDAGADPDNVNEAGQTALMAAARLGQAGACRQLIAAGADPARVDKDGDDAAAWARLNHHDDLAAELSPTPPAPAGTAPRAPAEQESARPRESRWQVWRRRH